MRRTLPETLAEPKHTSAAATLRAVWNDQRREVVLLVLITACSTVNTYIGSYMTTYAETTLGMSASAAMAAPIALGLTILVVSPFAGVLCERFGRRRSLYVSRFLTLALVVPGFLYLDDQRTLGALIVVIVVLTAVGVPGSVSALTVMAELFPPETRSAGIALSYALTVTIFGATTQFVVAWLIGVTGSAMAPAYYLIAMALLSVVAMTALPSVVNGRSAPRPGS